MQANVSAPDVCRGAGQAANCRSYAAGDAEKLCTQIGMLGRRLGRHGLEEEYAGNGASLR